MSQLEAEFEQEIGQEDLLALVRYDAQGLVPAIVQDAADRRVLAGE